MNTKIMLSRLKEYRFHFLFWTIYILYEIIITTLITGVLSTGWDLLIHYILYLSLFYFNAHVVLKKTRKRYAIWLVPLLILIELAVQTTIAFYADKYLLHIGQLNSPAPIELTFPYVLRLLWRSLSFVIFSTGYYYLISSVNKTKTIKALEESRLNDIIENQRIVNELAHSQNAFLKAQINPHFLFNTLNYLYSETWKTAPEAAGAILSLSGLMRYNLESMNREGQVGLMEEIEQLENFLNLYRIRQSQKVYINLIYTDNLQKMKILPLILMTLVENMFKHGNLSKEDTPGIISIKSPGGALLIETDNLKGYRESSGYQIGIGNIKERLRLVYGSRSDFSITESDERFKIKILIEPEEEDSPAS